jgi:hypothetical protein
VLDLSLCERVTGSGFATFRGCRQMATLSLNGCASLNDGGLRAIGRNVSLTKLDLSNCQLITDVGVAYLRGLAELTGWCLHDSKTIWRGEMQRRCRDSQGVQRL